MGIDDADPMSLGEISRSLGRIEQMIVSMRAEHVRLDVYGADRIGLDQRIRSTEDALTRGAGEQASMRRMVYGAVIGAALSFVSAAALAILAAGMRR